MLERWRGRYLSDVCDDIARGIRIFISLQPTSRNVRSNVKSDQLMAHVLDRWNIKKNRIRVQESENNSTSPNSFFYSFMI